MPTHNGRRKILVRETNWLGDVILSLPFLDALREKNPDAHISILARPHVAALLQHHPAVDKIILVDDRGLHAGLGMFNLAGDLRGLNADVAYLLPNSFSSAWLMWLARVPERIGFATDGRSALLSRAIKKTARLRAVHEVRLYLRLLDIEPDESAPLPHPRLKLQDSEKEKAKEQLGALGIDRGRPIVGMVPGAVYGTAKRWPPERFAALAERLSEEREAHVLLFGAASEKDVAERIERRAPKAALSNLAGKTRLRDLAALMAACRVLVTNDTGGMHVAAAVGTPVVAIFGSTNPMTTSPVGDEHVLIRHPVDCSPCLLRHCPIDHRCMTAIEIDEVFEAVCGKIAQA